MSKAWPSILEIQTHTFKFLSEVMGFIERLIVKTHETFIEQNVNSACVFPPLELCLSWCLSSCTATAPSLQCQGPPKSGGPEAQGTQAVGEPSELLLLHVD